MSNTFKTNLPVSGSFSSLNPTLKKRAKPTWFCLFLFVAGSLNSPAQTNTWVQKSDLGYDAVNVPELTARYGAVGFSIGGKGYLGTGYDVNYYTKDFWQYDSGANTWTQKADFGGTARYDAVGFSIGGKGYLGTGYDVNYRTKDFWEYDPAANIWTQKADFGGTARHEAVGFGIGNKGYLGTGSAIDGYKKDFWEYDPAADTWTQKMDFGGAPRSGTVGFNIGSTGYVGTGYNNRINYKDFWEYDPAVNRWTQKADFKGTARLGAVGFSIGDKGYIGTGNSGYPYPINYKDFWEYDPTANTWTQKADFGGTVRYKAVGFSIGNKSYIGNGSDGGFKKDFWEYDPAVNAWELKTDFGGTVRGGAVGFNIGGKGFLGMGVSGTGLRNDFWEYDPLVNSWAQKADFVGTTRSGPVGFSIGSKGYIGTGYGDFGTKKDFWEYDPRANIWTQRADFVGVGRTGAVGFSIGNKGYLGTGYDISTDITMKDFWEYDPVANKWTRKANMGGAVRSGAVGFSISGKGYIGTGRGGGFFRPYYKDFWEYDPVADAWTQKADFGGTARGSGVGFSIGSKGWIGTGYDSYGNYKKDFWEYDPADNTWAQKADFEGTARSSAVGFSIGSKGYIGTGSVSIGIYTKDFWEYTPDSCTTPTNLRVPKISDTCARLNWNVPDSSVEHIKVSYRRIGDIIWIEDRKKSLENSKVICGLTPKTTYEWKVRNICTDEKTGWVKGPDFTTTSSAAFSSDVITADGNNVQDNSTVQVMPNPNKGNFIIQMHLPGKATSATLLLYNSTGQKIWQQHAGRLNGSASISIALENKLSAGLYVLIIQHDKERLMQKVMMIK